MSSQTGAQGPPSGAPAQKDPPFAPRDAGLGGSPSILPDVPIAVVFMVLYLIFGIIHIKIFKSNKLRGHKFVFNGAILGLCKIRIVTMILRIAWANYPKDVGLAIAANIFTYVGTIILYMVNWFFAQRVIRAQHPTIGWSTIYRIFHRAGLVFLVLTLLGLIISQIWKFFTLDKTKLEAFHIMFLIAQTYATAFCFAPAILVTLSLLIPRTEVEKFGAGRLRYNISILIVAVFILSIGQVFRCVLAWIPITPLVDVQRGIIHLPWYLSKGSFYAFNFVTEILVVMLFAISRVDLRFYVPNGSRKMGDYSRSRLDLQDDEKNLPGANVSRVPMSHVNDSNETLHRYQSSIFDDTQTLADSLRYPHSTLEVDEKTGNWKVKRLSTDSSKTRHISMAKSSQSTLYGGSSSRSTPHTSFSKPPHYSNSSGTLPSQRTSRAGSSTPPVPELPAEWPLSDAGPLRASHLSNYGNGQPHRPVVRKKTFELENHELNNVNIGDAVTEALAKLEMNSERIKSMSPITPPPAYSNGKSPIQIYRPSGSTRNSSGQSSPKKIARYSVYPPRQSPSRSRANSNAADTPRYSVPMTHSNSASSSKQPSAVQTPRSSRPQSAHDRQALSQSPSLEIISLLNHMSSDQSRIVDASLLREPAAAATTHLQRSPMLRNSQNPPPPLHTATNSGSSSSSNYNANATTTYHASSSSNDHPRHQRPQQQQQQQQQQKISTGTTPERGGADRAKTQTSSNYSHEYSPSSSTNSRENEWAAEEFRKFSSEAALRFHHSP